MSQIDLVPTLAVLSGVSIPFSNLGVCIRGLFDSSSTFRSALLANFIQMRNYTVHYLHEIGFVPVNGKLSFMTEDVILPTYLERLTNEQIISLLQELQAAFRLHWTHFDLNKMAVGITLIASSVFAFFAAEFLHSWDFLGLSVQLIASLCFCWVDHLIYIIVLLSACLIIRLLVICFSTSVMFILSFMSILGSVYFSNSFLVHEFYVTIFLLQTLLVFQLICYVTRSARYNYCQIALLMCVSRLSMFVEVCREESFSNGYCRLASDMWFSKPVAKLTSEETYTAGIIRFVLSTGILITALTATFYFIPQSRPPPSFKRFCSARFSLLVFAAVIVCGCWALDLTVAITNPAVGIQLRHVRIYLARGFFVYQFMLLWQAFKLPDLAYAHSGNREPAHVPSTELFRFTSHPIRSTKRSLSAASPGSDCFDWLIIVLILSPALTILLFLNEVHVVPVFVLPATILLHRTTRSQNHKPANVRWSDGPSWQLAAFLCLLDNASFYTTGHQPTLAGIPWHAAFAAFSGDHKTRWIPGLMVLTHIYAGSILIAFCSPLCISSTGLFSYNKRQSFAERRTLYLNDLDQLIWRILSCKSLLTFLCVVGAAVLRRHLMVWKIFAPRLIFSCLGLLVSAIVLMVVRHLVSFWLRRPTIDVNN